MMNYTIAQTLSNEQFKRRFGGQKDTFKLMVNTLKPCWRAVPKPGAKPNLGLEDRVLVALEYWREYRTYFHIGSSWGVSESTVCRIVHWVEATLISSRRFHLPGNKQLVRGFGRPAVVVFVDETYIRVGGRWCYLYRGIDEDGNLVDVRLSEKRDMEAAKAFFAGAHEVAEQPPERVATDGHTSYPRAIAEELGEEVEHEVRDCRGNPIEQSHRGIKQRYYPMLGFGAFESAERFCGVYDEVRNFLRVQCCIAEVVSLSQRRERFIERVSELQAVFQAA